MPSRRDVLQASLALPMAAAMTTRSRAQGPRIAVIGAGAFGGWTALNLIRRGARVVLVDSWGPGNTRASSGGDTRVIRTSYGTRSIYTAMAARALDLWQEHDSRFGRRFFRRTGGLWMFAEGQTFGRDSAANLDAAGQAYEWLPIPEAQRRFPQVSFEGVSSVMWEPGAGYLLARRACEHVVERVIAEGGTYRRVAVAGPVPMADGDQANVPLDDGSALTADAFVFACGPWLGSLFPEVIGGRVTPTRQEIHYFGTPAGDRRFSDDAMPVWVDFGDRIVYGIPGTAQHGFKVADDTSGPTFDPTDGSRQLTDAGIAAARDFVARRFPDLRGAPFLGGEVCQYEASPDSDFIIDRHPASANVWIAGGGSGHGFKMGPAVGELIARCVLGEVEPDAAFRLARFGAGERTPSAPPKWD